MSIFFNTMITIKNIQHISWEKSSVFVAPRPYHALVFREHGSAVFSHGNRSIISKPNTVTYMPANYSYHADYPEKNEIYVIHFDSNTNLNLENYSIFPAVSVSTLFKTAFKIWNDGEKAYYFKSMSIYFDILSQIAIHTDLSYNSRTYNDFYAALNYMKNNYTDSELSIASLADKANMSYTYFRKLFIESIGETPSHYLTTLRLQCAENLLMSGKHSIEDVAFLSGFNDSKYFSRVVKKIYGYPPSQLYKKHT